MKRLFYLFMVFSCMLAGCNKSSNHLDDPDNPKNMTLEISTNDLVFNAQGEEKDFTIYCNGNWTIVNESSWCKTDVTQGNGDVRVSVSVEPYVETQDRNTNLVIKAGDRTEVLTVTQKPGDAIILSKDKFNFEQAGGNITIEVTSNIDYQVWIPAECRSWIVQVPESRAVTTKNFCFVVAENEALDQRSGYIVFFGGYGLEDTVYVYQAQKDQLVFIKNTYVISRESRELTVELKTNVEYDVVIPNDVASWIHLITTRASRTDRLNFQIDGNPGIDMRTANVVVKDKNSNLSDTIKFIQNGEKATYIGDVVFRTEQDLIDFYEAGYTKVQGRVTVLGSALKTLQQLGNQLTEIDDSLILDCSSLTSLEGLSGLTKMGGSLHIYQGKISSFKGLERLKSIGGDVKLTISNLNSFEELKNLESIGGGIDLRIKNSDTNPFSFKGLERLKSINGDVKLSISYLDSFEGLENLERIGGDFLLYSNTNSSYPSFNALVSFKGLENLESIGGDFSLSSYDSNSNSSYSYSSITSVFFEGVENLRSVRNISIRGCRLLSNFCSLENAIRNMTGSFKAEGNSYNPTKEMILNGQCIKL